MISNLDYNQGCLDQRQTRRPADERTSARKADMIAQAAWLLERAVAEGYRSLDELVRKNSDRFAALGFEWRQAHPFRF